MQAAQSLQTRQPANAVRINRANPLTRALSLCHVPPSDRNWIDGAAPAYLSGLGTSFGRQGVARSYPGSTASRVQFTTPAFGDLTLLVLATPSSTANQVFVGAFKGSGGSGVSTGHYLSIEASGAIAAVSTSSDDWVVASGPTAVAGATYCIAARFVSGGGRDLFINGLAAASSGTARTVSGIDRVVIGAYQQSNGALAAAFGGNEFLTVVWSRALSDAELESVTANPWQLFAASQNHALSWSAYVAAGGTTISAGPGAASANGPSALLNASLLAGPAAASATGAGALFNAALAAGPGNASATGPNALLNVSLIAGPGAASATGVTASIATSGNTTVSATPAEAAAAGVAARLNVSLIAGPGNATADAPQAALAVAIPATPASAQATGVVALISTNGPVTVYAAPGNAVADGASALILGASMGGGGPSWNGGRAARNVRKVTLSPQKVKTKRELVEFVEKAAEKEAAAVAPVVAVQAPQQAPMPVIAQFDAVAAAIGEMERAKQAQLRRELEIAYRQAFDRELARRIAKLQDDDDMEVIHLYHEHRKQMLTTLAALLH